MNSVIYEVDDTTGEIIKEAIYSLEPMEALRNYVFQMVFKNTNWWEYQDKTLAGVINTPLGGYEWDDNRRNIAIIAYKQ